jgi:thiamine biosynthesis protein ThiS
MITVRVNGEDRQLNSETVAGLVAEMRLPAPLLLIEHNGTALRKSEWEVALLRAGDRIEILQISAGG